MSEKPLRIKVKLHLYTLIKFHTLSNELAIFYLIKIIPQLKIGNSLYFYVSD
jgi:hypothetical protein